MVPTCKSTIDCLTLSFILHYHSSYIIIHRRQAAHFVPHMYPGASNLARGGLLLFEQFIGRLHLEGVGTGHGNEAAEERVNEQKVA